MNGLPTIGITMGDAAGIGPEVIVKAIASGELSSICNTVIIGDRAHLEQVAISIGIAADKIGEVIDLSNLPVDLGHGLDSETAGRASAEYIIKAVELCRSGEIDAIATAPISKRSLHLGGYDFQGHTEFLAHLTDTKRYKMSFFGGNLRVVLLSTHLPLTEAIERVKREGLIDLIDFANDKITRLLGRNIKIAVAGLNPHASEGGMFGHEEADEIIPAIEHCRALGIDVSGPYSPDTIFLRCFNGEFDAVVALYHDQATIPVKALSFNKAVNVTLGLPIIRTSVDHGTAYDIAGKGVAEHGSMLA
nr:4-hydroxythreonine-4-phosphate dehydrogenase PdxA [Pyrinomonadaceae bacterium]